MKVKKWKVQIKFDWYAWEYFTENQIRMMLEDFVPVQVQNVKIVVEKEENEK